MAEIIWDSELGPAWPSDWPDTTIHAQFVAVTGDGADSNRLPDIAPSGNGEVIFTPSLRTVRYVGADGPYVVSLKQYRAVVDSEGYLCTPDTFGQPGERGIVLPSTDAEVLEPRGEEDNAFTWRVDFDLPAVTIGSDHISVPVDGPYDLVDLLSPERAAGVVHIIDRVSARDAKQAAQEATAARDLVLPARDETLAARDETLAHGITVDTSVGTRVFVGDTMIHGDTGWRDITGLLSTTYLDMNPEATAQIRRENSIVAINVYQGRNATASGFIPGILYMPEGFWSNRDYRTWGSTGIDTSSGADAAGEGSIYLGGRNYISTSATPNKRLAFTLWYFADSIWPTSLPGVPG